MKEKQFWVRLAGRSFWLEPSYEYMRELCRDYIIVPSVKEKEDFFLWEAGCGLGQREPLTVREEELWRERGEAGKDEFPSEYLESLAFYRKICEGLLFQDILLFHCSALEMDGEAYLFTAPSGTGKSSHVRLWREEYGGRVTVINDDKPLLRFSDSGDICVCGTPYGGKHGLQTNTEARVAGIVILSQAKENRIGRMTAREAYPFLLNQAYQKKEDGAAMIHTMDLIYRLSQLPVYAMGCTLQREAARMAYDALRKGREECD